MIIYLYGLYVDIIEHNGMVIRYLFFSLLFILPISLSQAKIYRCNDQAGKIIFKDTDCSSKDDSIKPSEIDDLPAKDVIAETPNNTIIEDGKPGKLIFSNNSRLSPPYTMKVNEVRVITETDDTLVLDVIYTYEHSIPADEISIFVTPNHGYWSSNQIQVSKGLNVGRASIGLSRSNMKKDRVTRSFTNIINIRFEHYKPKKYLGSIWSETIKYEKNWILKTK